MKRNYKKKRNLINKTGYTPGYDTEKNPVNYIPSEDITMANTPYPVYATPLDQNGNPIGKSIIMSPGGEYRFKGASYVKEEKVFQNGGENMFTVSGNQPLIIPTQGSYPLSYRDRGDRDVDGTLFSAAKKVSRFDENGKPLTGMQIRENQKIWNAQKEAYSPAQQAFNIWKNNPENTKKGYFKPQEYYDMIEELRSRPDVELEGKCDPSFSSTECGRSKEAAKEEKKQWSKRRDGGFFQAGGKKTIYVESKNDPRYRAYQDSVSAYNTSIQDKNETLDFIKRQLIKDNNNRGILDKTFNDKLTAVKKDLDYNVQTYPGGIKPIKSYVYERSDGKTQLGAYDVLKKPQEQVILRPTTTKQTTKPNDRANKRKPTEKEIKEWSEPGFKLNSVTDYINPKTKKVTQSWYGDLTRNEQAIQNNLKPEGLIQSNIELSADMSGLRPVVRIPKYYDVQENINQPFGGSQTNYRTSDLDNITSPDDLGQGNTRKIIPRYQKGGRNKIAPSLENQLLNKYVTPSTNRAMARAKQQGIRTGIHNGGLDAIRHSSSAAATSSVLPSWANSLPGVLPLNILATNIAGAAHEVNSPNSFKEHASDLYNNFVGSVVGTLPITEENKHDLLIKAQKNGILSDMGDKRPLNNKQTRPSNIKQNNMNNTTNSAFNRNIRGKRNFNQFLLGDTPEFRKGGQKSDWISDKISTLVREGYPQKQAVAIAYSMYENKHGNGGYQLPKYQFAGTAELDEYGQPLPKPQPNPTPSTNNQASGQNTFAPGNVNSWDIDNNGIPDTIQKPEGNPLFESKPDKNIFGEDGSNEKEESDTAPLDVKGEQPFQFFNPYSGFDIPTAASTLGSSIESGDTFGTVASGLKLATGLARNFLGGMGQERRKNYMTKQSYEKQREGMTGAGREEMKRFGGYYQEGGMQPGMEEGMEQPQGGDIQQQVAEALQQGASPEEVMQQLIQMGMPEDQAMALVQGIMEQMQPSTPQLKRGGMMYYQKGGEEEYGYEDEEEYGDLINKYPNRNPQIEETGEETGEETAKSTSIESATEANTTKEETPSYDKNSARDTWVAKTGMPWSEAKKLGYTSGSAKDNMKLLSELNDPRFKKEYLRKSSPQGEKTYNGGQLKEVVVTRPKNTYTNEDYQKAMRNKPKYSGNQGNISAAKEGNFITRTGEILANPLQSLSHYSKYKELPAEGFSKNNKNAHDQVIGILNPMYWANALSNAVDYAGEGEYKKAALESLDAAPAAGKLLRAAPKAVAVAEGSTAISNIGSRAANKVGSAVGKARRAAPLRNYFTPELAAGNKVIQLGQGAKRLGFEAGGYYQDGGDTYNEKDFKDDDIVRHSGGNTGLTKSEVNSLAKQYKMSPQEFLNIISYGEPGEGMSSRYELSVEGSDKYLPKNWREDYKKTKASSTGFRGALNKGLDYIGVEPMFNNGGYYQDGGEQQISQQVAQAMQQGMQPQEAMAMLMESGMTEDQAMQMVQAIMQQLQQMEEGTPQMRRGGEMIKRKDGSYSRRGLWDNIRDNEGSGKEPTKEMLEQEAKIKREYQEGGMEPEADPAQEMMQQVAQMLEQGADPQEVLQMLVEAGVPEDQAVQMVQSIMQQMQGVQSQQPTPQMRRGGRYCQEGGEIIDEQMEGEDEGAEGETPNMEQIEDQVEQALQQGADPQEILQQLVQMGMPQEEAMQMIQEILQEMQGGEEEEEDEEGTPQMSKGGKYMRALVGKTIKSYTYNPKTDSYIVSYE